MGPRQCRSCWKLGHGTKTKRQDLRCGNCSSTDGHETDSCTAQSKCTLCSGPHPSWNRRSCPVWLAKKKDARERHPPARTTPDLGNDEAWPALPRPSAAAPPQVLPPVALATSPTQTERQSVSSCSQTEHPSMPSVSVQIEQPPELPPKRHAVTQTKSTKSHTIAVQATPVTMSKCATSATQTPPFRPVTQSCTASTTTTADEQTVACLQLDDSDSDGERDPDLLPRHSMRGEDDPPLRLDFRFQDGTPADRVQWLCHKSHYIQSRHLDLQRSSRAVYFKSKAAQEGYYTDTRGRQLSE